MRLLRIIAAAALVLLALGGGASSAQALTLQPVGKFDQPIYVTSDPGNANRLFVVEREGTIEQVEGGVTSKFADISSKIGCGGSCQGERGLMSIAMAPDFDLSGRFFVDYANDVDGTIHVGRTRRRRAGHESALGSTPRDLLTIPHSDRKQPQRRPAAVRSRRQPLHLDRRRRWRQRPVPQRAEPEQPARQDPPDPTQPRWLTAIHGAVQQPLCGDRRRLRADLELRPAQPVPLLLRQPHRRHGHRRRRPGHTRGDRLRSQPRSGSGGRRRCQLRLELSRGIHRRPRRRSRVRLAANRRLHRTGLRLPAHSRPRHRRDRTLRDHRRLRGPGPQPRRPLRPLPLRRPLRWSDSLTATLASPVASDRSEGIAGQRPQSPSARTRAAGST